MPSFSSRQVVSGLLVAAVLAAGIAFLIWQNMRGGDSPNRPAPGFENVLPSSGITFRMSFLPTEQGEKFKVNLYDHGSGVAVGDIDGDGHDDVYFLNQLGPNALYRNKGDGTFEDVTAKAGVALSDRVCVAAAFADYDNDGDQDLFVTSTRGGNVLFQNQGNGTFKDVTRQAGVAHAGHSQMPIFFDYDNDGFLDLLVIQTAKWTTDEFNEAGKHYVGKNDLIEAAGSEKEPNLLYHNNGNGTFTDVSEKSGLKGRGWSADAAVFDFNDDGWTDVLITSMFGRAQLYRNNGDGTFSDVTRETLGRTSWGGMGVKVFDFNNDGKLDVYIVDMHSDMWPGSDMSPERVVEWVKYPYLLGGDYDALPRTEAVRKEQEVADLVQVHYDEVLFGNTFFKNRGGGRFEEVSDRAYLETFWPWGIAAGDCDNDGYEDVFQPAGMGYPWFYWPNYLLMNNGDETFTNRAAEEGIEPPPGGPFLPEKIGDKQATRSSRSAAVADFDGDGRLDIITNNFNDAPYYFRNRFPRKNYVAWRLTGTKSNRDALGAVVTLYLGNERMTRLLSPASGYLAQSSKVVHFGLGERTKIDRAEVRWPSGRTQTIDNPEVNKVHLVTEPQD